MIGPQLPAQFMPHPHPQQQSPPPPAAFHPGLQSHPYQQPQQQQVYPQTPQQHPHPHQMHQMNQQMHIHQQQMQQQQQRMQHMQQQQQQQHHVMQMQSQHFHPRTGLPITSTSLPNPTFFNPSVQFSNPMPMPQMVMHPAMQNRMAMPQPPVSIRSEIVNDLLTSVSQQMQPQPQQVIQPLPVPQPAPQPQQPPPQPVPPPPDVQYYDLPAGLMVRLHDKVLISMNTY